jgi:hypothetical protein
MHRSHYQIHCSTKTHEPCSKNFRARHSQCFTQCRKNSSVRVTRSILQTTSFKASTLTIQSRRLISSNGLYRSVQNVLSSGLPSKNIRVKISRTTIFRVALNGCESWSLTSREERTLRVFENTVLRKIFGPKRDKVTGEWRTLHNEELNNVYYSPNIIRVMK